MGGEGIGRVIRWWANRWEGGEVEVEVEIYALLDNLRPDPRLSDLVNAGRRAATREVIRQLEELLEDGDE